ncbi:TetR/AcrR family transcriptional regulator [Nocardia farcinica]|uniref:Uncharacterized HTH-type transcriptional regulator TtgW n=1 Tax=Nocardia farcinica TaxID=37329 RepID=A0A0H5NMW2_NOCFR|nr:MULTISPECIES: TetR/AcrR family transcriptional regulator [Nocardia]AXK85238.1 TetR/AcrR family transcriptional regulator [Nocardia farcinica]MBF6067938.1 TetR/AcrR family transcriptional regulator [Nocardia farcinica]MBF6184728.1 TetR/AcrR family transcriptional regulator [Nocardia farcinica]MBF6231157.1 TetR/AcrR family transcriptional regulator [Nocardia farcinica]MBF6246606.1 TetR/AcrR family transcriptional regulator [Nocardia elegans]
MTRLTRKEAHARTRERLVETAEEMFLANGYTVTSLDKVAARAGFSKGAVYSNFATKHELGLAVLERIRLARVLSLAAAVLGADTLDARIAAFGRWAEENIGDVGWLTVEVEFAIGTRHLDDLREELAVRRREITDTLAELIDQQAREFGVTLAVPAHDAAVRLLSLGIGLGVQRAFDPEVPVTPIVDALRELLTGAATRPAGRSVAPDAAKP